MNVISLQEMIPHILDCLALNRTVQQKEKHHMRRERVWMNCLFFIISVCIFNFIHSVQHTNTFTHSRTFT